MSSKRKGRGPTRGYKSAHLVQTRGGQKLLILLPPGVGRPLEEFRSEFLTGIGVAVRDMAPLTVKKWSEITDAQKVLMIDRLQVSAIVLDYF